MCLACEQDVMWFAYLESRGLLKPDDPAAVDALFSAFPVQPLPMQPRTPSSTEAPASRRQHAKSIFLRRPDGRMTDLTSLSLAQARDALRKREFSAPELADAHLAAIEQARALNAFVLETPDRARAMARAADARLAKGEGGPLEGLPLGVKDVFCTAGVRTTACSHILENFVPPYNRP